MTNGSPAGADLPDAKIPGHRLSKILRSIADDTTRERIAIADILRAMDQRAIAALMFIFALPIVLPLPPGASTVFAAPLVFLSTQMMLRMDPWLPKIIRNRSLARADFLKIIDKAEPWLARAERLLSPRLTALTNGPAEIFVGAVCLFLSLIVLLPIPLGNMPPAFAICVFALGILEDDGLWILTGFGVTIAAIVLVWGVVWAMLASALFILSNLFA